jgi:hypothetical protein
MNLSTSLFKRTKLDRKADLTDMRIRAEFSERLADLQHGQMGNKV